MMESTTENTEIEWAFQGSDSLFEKIQTSIKKTGFLISKEAKDDLISTYYDTPTLDIRKTAGLVLRVRDTGQGRFIQTVKGKSTPTSDPAISNRLEYEVDIPSTAPDLQAIKDEDLAQRFFHFSNDDLSPLFITQYRRHHFHVELKDKDQTTLQICHDKGIMYLVNNKEVNEAIDEIEIEFIKGAMENAVKFVAYLRQKIGPDMIDQPMGKGRRALDLYDRYTNSAEF